MGLSVTLILIGGLIAAIWLIIEFKRMKHKFLSIFLIGLVILGYFGFMVSLKGQDIDYKTFEGIKEAGGIYFSWFFGIFIKFKDITAYAINLDWKNNSHDKEIKLFKKDSKINEGIIKVQDSEIWDKL